MADQAQDEASLKTYVPPAARTQRAQQFWRMGWMQRAKLFVTPGNEEFIQSMFGVMAESFSYEQFAYAIKSGYDLVPTLEKRYLSNRFTKGIARAIIRNQWSAIWGYLTRPSLCIQLISAVDATKGQLLRTPEGGAYMNWLCYHILVLLREKGEIRGGGVIAPPHGECVLHHGLCLAPRAGPSPGA